MKRKLLSILLATEMTAGMLGGWGGGETAESTSEATEATEATEETESIGAQIEVDEEALTDVAVEGDYSDADLTVFIFAQDHEKAVYQSLIDKFMEETGANVTFEVTTSDEYG